MRILELKLDAFGPFTQVALDFSRGHAGLHVVYGPNEAGKTSALRAIRDLFYGIPHRSPDDFIHDSRKIRLGGLLEHSSGEQLAFVRLKKTKNALVQGDGETPLDPAVLSRFLGGVDQALFQTVFGIDHETLVKGGQAIIEGGGNLGNALFAASSGIANFKGVQQKLQEKADELFKAGGRNQRIPRAIAELREADRQLKTLQLPSERWARHEEALRVARERQAALEARRREVESRASRLRRIQAALPLFSERSQILGELSGLRDAVLLPEDFGERRRNSQLDLAAAAQEIRRARQSIEELTGRLAAIALPETLLAAEADIEALRNRRAEQRKAQEDRLKRERDLQEKEHAARDVLQSLGRARDLAQAEPLRLRVDEPPRITQLAHQYTELSARRDQARALARKHGELLAKHRQERAAIGCRPDLSELRGALAEAQKEGELEGRLGRLEDQLAPLERELAVALRQLPGWKGTWQDLEQLTVPLPESILRYEADLQAAEDSVRELERAASSFEEAIRGLESRLRGQSLQNEVPCEQDLEAARRRREAGWSLVRSAWLGITLDEASREAFGAAPEPPPTLAEAYEKAVSRADDLADRLRREAQSVATKAEWLSRAPAR